MSLDSCSPSARGSDEFDDGPQPSFEQVAKSQARALRFAAPCAHAQERESQIAEGRRMARAESQSGSSERREPREHVGEPARNHPHPRAEGQPRADGQPRSRSRHRNRNRDRAPA